MSNRFIICFIVAFTLLASNKTIQAQNYTSYLSGSTTDVQTIPHGGVCLMGGATENDSAMFWFLKRAQGGDILVLRASGSDGYNSYMYNDFPLSLNSVESIVFHDSTAAYEPYIHQRIAQAEAIWFAGGNQWNYMNYWKNTPIDSLFKLAVQRNVVFGGTSAGMAILGGVIFTAENGSISTVEALSNPYHSKLTLSDSALIPLSFLEDVITDTHYDNPDRRGRHLTFLARLLKDRGSVFKGIACEEYTAVCIDTLGLARVFGDYPAYNDFAFFVQPNCELAQMIPEQCLPNTPLTWDLNQQSVKACKIPGTPDGKYFFDLRDWESDSGGLWLDWSALNGQFNEQTGSPIHCSSGLGDESLWTNMQIYPNPTQNQIYIYWASNETITLNFALYNNLGMRVFESELMLSFGQRLIDLPSNLPSGWYSLKVHELKSPYQVAFKIIIQR